MKLEELQTLINDHSGSVRELNRLNSATKNLDWRMWWNSDMSLPIPKEYVDAILQSRILELKSKIKEQSRQLGIDE